MKTVNLDSIDINDRRFCVSYPLNDKALLASIEKVGVLEPVTLLDATPYIIIAGFKRVSVAIKLGLTGIPALTVSVDEQQALFHSIHGNLGRGMNIVERAQSIERMLNFRFSSTEIHEAMILLGLDPHQKVLERLVVLSNGEVALKDFVLAKSLSMKNVESLLWFDAGERARIISLLSSIRTTESFIREILELLSLIKVKKGRIDLPEIRGVSDPQELKKSLKKLTNPILSSLEQRLKEAMLRCSLPPNLDIKVDPFFEKGYIDILIRAKTDREVRDALEKLGVILDKGYIGSILELTKG
jgi:ParB-like chromosome segregation protein Spo0J